MVDEGAGDRGEYRVKDDCFWLNYQADPTYENCCHFLKHRAYCRIVRDDWLTRPLPDSFFDEAGHHSGEQMVQLFEEIPDGFKAAAYAIIVTTHDVANSELGSCIGFRHLLFSIQKDLLKHSGIDLHIPYYWYADGVMIPPEYIVRITNGIIGWVCDDSKEGCLMEGECRYFKREVET